ncbi:MAG TPA: DUF3592 domain-containing protein, partial [Candidatus Limnocylindrales bacterium]
MTARQSMFTLGRGAFWPLFGAIWLLVGVVMLIAAIALGAQEADYARSGVATTGIVLTKDIVTARSSSNSNSSTEYRVTYRFTTADGSTLEGRSSIGVTAWEKLVERGPIAIRYVAGNPGTNRVDAG